ncbi:Transcription factor HES-1-A [Oryzias melastigma]|uniref:Transcription factor HES-1-A n=1 Tax=Oryzias melastigma TaxID=30732 RepID=A0A834FDM4_ORYME|nr:Transcription factor HES-1-A [Oryzias melastigma]
MEKRRRARINESLTQLKGLILDALKKDSCRHSKLEKADILEMTVKHLRSLQRLHMTAAVHSDPSVLSKYRAGFSECVGEVTRFLSSCEGVDSETRTRLLSHLASCVSQINAVNVCGPHLGVPGQSGGQGPVPKSCSQIPASTETMKLFAGFQVVPSPDGQFALLVPSAGLTPLSVHSSRATAAAPALTSDCVWRPW